jgi:hypothetical protein
VWTNFVFAIILMWYTREYIYYFFHQLNNAHERGNIFRLETCMNSLVKVPPYSKLNFQGKHFFTQNWCNKSSPLKQQLEIWKSVCMFIVLAIIVETD